jgi:hypothetical protein
MADPRPIVSYSKRAKFEKVRDDHKLLQRRALLEPKFPRDE